MAALQLSLDEMCFSKGDLQATSEHTGCNLHFVHIRWLENCRDPASRMRSCLRMISRMPTLAAIAYRTSRGYPIIYPRNDLDYAARFLHMMFAWPTQKYEVDPVLGRALEKIIILWVTPSPFCPTLLSIPSSLKNQRSAEVLHVQAYGSRAERFHVHSPHSRWGCKIANSSGLRGC